MGKKSKRYYSYKSHPKVFKLVLNIRGMTLSSSPGFISSIVATKQVGDAWNFCLYTLLYSVAVVKHILGSLDLVPFKVILGSFDALAISPKRLFQYLFHKLKPGLISLLLNFLLHGPHKTIFGFLKFGKLTFTIVHVSYGEFWNSQLFYIVTKFSYGTYLTFTNIY